MKPGSDELAGVIVDDGVGRRAEREVARFADGGDATRLDEHRAVLDVAVSAQPPPARRTR